ncbi:MAG TPA: hypothetical protein VID19_12395 [Candidatus Eremiobacteraceae bacterium]|jgi:uncharacterized membrane protein
MQSTLEMRWRSGAVWFYWTAVLAIAASLLRSSGQLWAGAIGLGVLQAPLLPQFAGSNRIAALVAAVAALALLGWFAGLGKTWAFIIGMIAYTADGALLAMSAQWFGVGVHVVVLVFMYGGLVAAGMVKENERLERELAIRASLAKDRASRPAMPENKVTPTATDPLAAPQAFRPGANLPPPSDEERS